MSRFLEVSNITKQFGNANRAALSGISLYVERQELLALVGASGSGKTTLLRILAGLECPDRGEVTMAGQVLTADSQLQVPPERRNMGFVFQNHALFPHLSVQDNVGFGIFNSPARAQRIAELLDLVGMADLAGRFPHELSGGEQQRVALVRALAPQPDLLLMDEPFSSLDESLRCELRDETARLIRQQGTTTIMVTHHLDDARAISDRIVVMRDGAIDQDTYLGSE